MRFPTTIKTLIDKLKEGDDASWQIFFERYRNVIIDLGVLKGLTDDECEELLQEVMKRFYQRSQSFVFDPDIAKFRTYFGRIINGLIIDIKRKRIKNTVSDDVLESVAAEEPMPDELFDNVLQEHWRNIIKDDILKIMRERLSPVNYNIFEMHVLQHASVADTAEALQVSAARIYLVKNRGLKMMKNIINEIVAEDERAEFNINDF